MCIFNKTAKTMENDIKIKTMKLYSNVERIYNELNDHKISLDIVDRSNII